MNTHINQAHKMREGTEGHSIARQRAFLVRSKKAVSDLFDPVEWIYWTDFILSVTAAYVCVSLFLAWPMSFLPSWICFLAGTVLIYRSSLFVHEIVHMPRKEMKAFRWFWNFFAGVPMMVPSFSYESHTHHHSSRHYGTEEDGEYLPLASGSIAGVAIFLAQIFFQPILVYLRYLLLTPFSFVHPEIRRWTLTHASSLVINFKYSNSKRPARHNREDLFWELFTSFRAMVMIGLVIGGVMPVIRLPKLLMVAMFVLTLNHIRTLAAHRYRSHGEAISHLEQFQDSTNISGNWFTELLCPLGLRYHALHHLFPGIPYHNLGRAHRRLMSELPEGSIYHESVYPNFRSVIRELFAQIRSGETHSHSR